MWPGAPFWGGMRPGSWREPRPCFSGGGPAQAQVLGHCQGTALSQGQAQVSLPFCLHNTPTKSPILQVSKLRLVLMRSHGSEAAELGPQRRIWANIPHGETDCQGLGQMLASAVTSGGCPPCRSLPRRDALVNAFSLLCSGKGTPDMQSLWRGVCPPDSTAGLASRLPPSTHTPTPPQHIPSWQQESCLPGRAAGIGCSWKHIM